MESFEKLQKAIYLTKWEVETLLRAYEGRSEYYKICADRRKRPDSLSPEEYWEFVEILRKIKERHEPNG